MTAANQAHLESIIVPGQLKLRTIRGRHGPFNVGLLACPLGEFVVKDPEFEQYKEGKYDGEFAIGRIFAKSFVSLGGVRVEIRASLNGMTLSGIDKLGREEARNFNVQEVDPIDEDQPATALATPTAASAPSSNDPLIDTRPFGMDAPATVTAADGLMPRMLRCSACCGRWPRPSSWTRPSIAARCACSVPASTSSATASMPRLSSGNARRCWRRPDRQTQPRLLTYHPPGFLPHAGEDSGFFLSGGLHHVHRRFRYPPFRVG